MNTEQCSEWSLSKAFVCSRFRFFSGEATGLEFYYRISGDLLRKFWMICTLHRSRLNVLSAPLEESSDFKINKNFKRCTRFRVRSIWPCNYNWIKSMKFWLRQTPISNSNSVGQPTSMAAIVALDDCNGAAWWLDVYNGGWRKFAENEVSS